MPKSALVLPLFSSIARALRRTRLSLFPLAGYLARYRSSELLPDAFAGLNVALIAFPQSVIYALMADLPVKYGLYGALIAAVATALFSGSRILNMGPTNSTAVVLLSSFAALDISTDRYYLFGPCLLVLTGIFLVIGAFLNIASTVRYISKSVIFGYMYAVITIMIVRQIHNALGFDLTFTDNTQQTLFDTLCATVAGLPKTDTASLSMCILCIVFFYGWRKLFPRSPVIALTVLSLTFTGIVMTRCFHVPLQTLRIVRIGDWHLSLLGFTGAHISELSGTALILSFVTLIDGTTILQTLSARMGKRCNINQMVFGMGLANILCGIGSGMPASCSMTRSAANYVSGAKTPVASLFCAFFCFLGIVIFGPFLNFIPESGLSMLIILLGLGLFEKHSLKIILKADRADACVFAWTLLSAFLFPLHVAILIGILISIALFLKKAALPTLHEINRETIGTTHGNDTNEISVIHATGHLFFGSAEVFRDQIRTLCKRPQLKVIIIKLRRILYIDATCLLALEELLRYMRTNDRRLILTEVSPQALEIFKRSGLYETVGADFIFLDDEEQTQQPTQVALECARRIIGKENITVRLLTQSPAVVHKDTLKQTATSLQKPLSEPSVRTDVK